jgi:RimJ/RimL family protein N-acetyltransferase
VAEAADPARLEALSKAAAGVCDGDGAGRIVSKILVTVCGNAAPFSARPACMNDAEVIWQWRNESATSRFYRNTKPTPRHEHMKWFRSALQNRKKLLVVVEYEENEVGHVRFDLNDNDMNCAEISIYVNPNFRGTGYGKDILEAAMNYAKKTGIQSFTAQTHKDNKVSTRLFESLGFRIEAAPSPFFCLVLSCLVLKSK